MTLLGWITPFVDSKVMDIPTVGDEWRPYIDRQFPFGTYEECGLACIYDSSNFCAFFVFDSGQCYFGNWDTTASVLSSASDLKTAHVLKSTIIFKHNFSRFNTFHISAFDRHGLQVPKFALDTEYGPHIWPHFVYDSVIDIDTNEKCAAICLIHQGPCQLFYQESTTCYLGRFNYYLNGILSNNTLSSFYYLVNKYCKKILSFSYGIFIVYFAAILELYVDGLFDPYPSTPDEWRSHVHETKNAPSEEECGLYCDMDPTNHCGYYVHENNNCHLGSLDNTGSVLGSGGQTETIHIRAGNVTHLYTYNQCIVE